MVVNEYSLDADDFMDASFDAVEEALGDSEANTARLEEAEGNRDTGNVVKAPIAIARVSSSNSVDKSVDESPPKIPNDITVIPLTKGTGGIKSEPRDGTVDAESRARKLPSAAENRSSLANPHLVSIATGKHSSLTILPVTTSMSKVPTNGVMTKNNGVVSKNRNTVEFSLTPDVTIKTVLGSNATAKYSNSGSYPNSLSVGLPKQPTFSDQYCGSTSYSHPIHGNGTYVTPAPTGYENKPASEPLPTSAAYTSTANNIASCLYNKPYPTSSSCASLPSCSFPSTCSSKSCSIAYPTTPLPTPSQSQAVMPYYSQNSPAFCNYNAYAPSSSPLSSPKHPKPPMSAMNPCRMSSSPVPAYMRSKEPSYSAPLLCNIISESLAGIMPPESSFKPQPAWNLGCSAPSFRSPTSPASMNFPLPSPAALAPPPSSPAVFPSYANQANSLMIPVNQNQVKQQNNAYNNSFRSNFTAPFTPNSFQRAQCCFSASQIQCFNAGCTGGSQQQFSIVQHSTRLSNLKSSSMDSVSSLLQYHTYFKKY